MVFNLGRSSLDTSATPKSIYRELFAIILENTMFLSNVHIKNFRGIEDLSLSLDDVCVLIGENNTGKTTIIDAIRLCLEETVDRTPARFMEYDYHLKDGIENPTSSPPIEITLTFQEQSEDASLREQMEPLQLAEVLTEPGLRIFILKISSVFNQSSHKFVSDYDFLDVDLSPLPEAKHDSVLSCLKQLTSTFYLSSIRDAAQEFDVHSEFWSPFVTALKMNSADRIEIESELKHLNFKILQTHESFEAVNESLQNVARLMRLQGNIPVSIDALPSRMFEILSRTRVNIESSTGAKIPIDRHGGGTQSVSVICLFEAFLQLRRKELYDGFANPLLALEEPEAHLHPSAVKALGDMVQEIPGQKLISTHSGDLIASIPLHKIRRLRRKRNKIVVYQLREGALNPDELEEISYLLRMKRDNLLFARCWLLVEGKTEATLLPECAHAMNLDLASEGIYCVEYSQVGNEKLIKFANELGIEWFVLSDGDKKGNEYVTVAERHLHGRKKEAHIHQLDAPNMEAYLCANSFGQIYLDSVSEQKARNNGLKLPFKDLSWDTVLENQKEKSKSRNALLVARKIGTNGYSKVPTSLKEVITKTLSLARSAA